MMSARARSRSMLPFVAFVAIAVALQAVCWSSPRAQETKTYRITFKLAEGTLLHYETFNQMEQFYSGTDVAMNQTSTVDLAYGGKTDSTGASMVELRYLKVKTSIVMGGKLQDWDPPIKLEGATIKVTVLPTGEVVRYDPGRYIPGLQNVDDIRDIINAWFIRYPDSSVAVGGSWTQEIEEGKRETGESDTKGTAVYTLKKVEKKGDLEIATIEGKANLKLNQDSPAGFLIGNAKVDVKAQVALNGGYIVEIKETMEIRGDVMARDPLTDKETKREAALTRHFERKLKQ
jgi:hypothetical protein